MIIYLISRLALSLHIEHCTLDFLDSRCLSAVGNINEHVLRCHAQTKLNMFLFQKIGQIIDIACLMDMGYTVIAINKYKQVS